MTDNASAQSDTQPFVPVPPEPESTAAQPGPTAAQPEPIATETVTTSGVRAGTSRPRGTGWVNVALALAIAVAIGGIGFAAGRMTSPASSPGAGNGAGNGRTFGNGQFPGGGYFPGGGDGGGFGGVFGAGGTSIEGTVEAISADTLTLKLASGQTVQLSLNGTTTYHSQAAASSSDVKAGGSVIVRIQLNRGQGTGATSPSASDVTVVP